MSKLLKQILSALVLLILLPASTALAAVPNKPDMPTITKTADNGVVISWTKVDGATSYEVWYKKSTEDDTKLIKVTSNSNSTTIPGLEASTKYSFHVNAVNKDGQSPPSAAKEETTTSTGDNIGAVNHLNLLKDIFAGDKVSQKFNRSPGKLISDLLNVVLYVAGFLMMTWVFWGIFQYIFAGGNKEALGKARGRIIWAIVGFIFVILAFAVSQYAETFFKQELPSGITKVTVPK